MARIEESVEINASARKIWPIVSWDKVPQWMNTIKKVEFTSEETDKTGATAHWIGKIAGVKSEWDTETTEWEPFTREAWRTTAGNFTSIGSMTLAATETGTKATFMMEYELPHTVLGRAIDKLRVYKAIEKGAKTGLRKLKEISEG